MNKSSSYRKTTRKIEELLLQTSAHGLPRLLKTRHFVFKVIWTLVLINSSFWGSYFTLDILLNYLKYETNTIISIVNENRIEFPSISICAVPNFEASLRETILSVTFEQNGLNIEEYFDIFHDPIYNKCFRFNSGKNINGTSVPVLKSTQSGSIFGVTIEISIIPSDGYDYSAILVNFHNKSSPPFDLQHQGYWLNTGSSTSFRLDRVFYQNLDKPFSGCLKNVRDFTLNKTLVNLILGLNMTYSQQECFILCVYMKTLEESNCHCNSTILEFRGKCMQIWFNQNEKNEANECNYNYALDFITNRLRDGCLEYCPLECDSTELLISSQTVPFPESGLIKNKTRAYEIFPQEIESYEQIKRNYLRINANYNGLKYTVISQIAKTELFSCISSIGGIFSLFFGISLISFIEIFEIIFEVLVLFISNAKV